MGYSELEEGVPIRHAFLYRHGALSDIDPGYPRGSRAHDINERGDIAGSFHDELGVDQPFVVSGGATHVLRPNLGKGLAFAGGRAESVGEGGEVIGWSVHPDGGSECLVWVPTGCRRCPFATWLDGASPAETGGAL